MDTTGKCKKLYHVKKGDNVVVISGGWKGEEGTIKAVLKKKDRVVVDFKNLSDKKKEEIGMRTIKKSAANPNGGLVERSVSVHVSNVKLLTSETAAKAE